MSKSEHIHGFDWLRLIAAVSVIYMHVASAPLRGALGGNWHLINALTSFGFTAVPLFFMMSGHLLLSNPKTEDVGILLKHRIPRLLFPLAIWSLLAILWKIFLAKDIALLPGELLNALHTPAWVHLWYMYTLIAIYLISPLLCAGLRSLGEKGRLLLLILLLLPSLRVILQALLPASLDRFLEIDLIAKLTFFGGHLNTFLLGWYLGNIKRRIPLPILLTSGAALLGCIIYGTFRLTSATGSFNSTFMNQSAGFEALLAAVLFLAFKQNVHRPSALLSAIPIVPLSLPIYLMHNLLLSFTNRFYVPQTFLDTVWMTAGNLLVCFLCVKTLASIKPVCFLFTGIPYKTACASCNWIFTFRRLKSAFGSKNIRKTEADT
ncbi:MAG: acyltransferase [Clostridia bacterium]|nr:acyltransferase [Clostridia bacterium]